jgi:hypothetical protein
MKAVILYNTTRGDRFSRYDPETSWVEEGFDVEVPDADTVEETLERIWRAANRVDGSDIEQVPSDYRSLSVGDLVHLDPDNLLTPGRTFSVESFGFKEQDTRAVFRKLLTQVRDGINYRVKETR